ILLADFFARIADRGFSSVTGNFFDSWFTALAYTFQIYFDFSGYCDMAIGIGLLFNIRLIQNFNAPYRAENITDFWKRWHMTLGRFLLSSVYIPLGGNRHGKIRTCINLLITFFISGLWHGASYLFILWGMIHGAAMVLHRVWKEYLHCRMPVIPARILTFLFVLLAWIPFRAESMQKALALYKSMFLPSSWKVSLPSVFELILFVIGIFIILFLTPVPELEKKFRSTWINALITVGLLLGSISLFVKTSPFIYFNF
ncbi:MAG: MBOAT family protein, partial [Lentisphaeria bacterium]|nr:MBOAT family protein [Lentisphaeria bacterium]